MLLIGTPGAIVAAYLIFYPRVKVWVLVFNRISRRIPTWIPLFLWICFQFLMIAIGDEEYDVSLAAHVGGIVAGAILVLVLLRRDGPLFANV